MNQADLAKKTKCSQPMICRILMGQKRPGLQLALRLERETGIPVRTWATAKPERLRKEFDRWAKNN